MLRVHRRTSQFLLSRQAPLYPFTRSHPRSFPRPRFRPFSLFSEQRLQLTDACAWQWIRCAADLFGCKRLKLSLIGGSLPLRLSLGSSAPVTQLKPAYNQATLKHSSASPSSTRLSHTLCTTGRHYVTVHQCLYYYSTMVGNYKVRTCLVAKRHHTASSNFTTRYSVSASILPPSTFHRFLPYSVH